MVEFLKTLAIACIPAIITGIVTYIVARKNAASQISIIKQARFRKAYGAAQG